MYKLGSTATWQERLQYASDPEFLTYRGALQDALAHIQYGEHDYLPSYGELEDRIAVLEDEYSALQEEYDDYMGDTENRIESMAEENDSLQEELYGLQGNIENAIKDIENIQWPDTYERSEVISMLNALTV